MGMINKPAVPIPPPDASGDQKTIRSLYSTFDWPAKGYAVSLKGFKSQLIARIDIAAAAQ